MQGTRQDTGDKVWGRSDSGSRVVVGVGHDGLEQFERHSVAEAEGMSVGEGRVGIILAIKTVEET